LQLCGCEKHAIFGGLLRSGRSLQSCRLPASLGDGLADCLPACPPPDRAPTTTGRCAPSPASPTTSPGPSLPAATLLPPQAVPSSQRQLTALSAIQLVSKAALTPVFYQFPPSAVAAACLCKAREGLGQAPVWPSALHSMTGYSPSSAGDAVRECMDLISVLGLAN
jgi:hypothetical protein